MKSTTYTRFCRRLFSKSFEKFNISETSKNRLLEKADISMAYQEYYSMVLMNIIIGFIVSFVSTLILYLLVPTNTTALLILYHSVTHFNHYFTNSNCYWYGLHSASNI